MMVSVLNGVGDVDRHCNNKVDSSNDFIIMSSNVRSISNNLCEIGISANKNNASVLILTETWASAENSDEEYFIPGFTIISRADKLTDMGRGGGILVYAKHNVDVVEGNIFNKNRLQRHKVLFVKLELMITISY